MFFRNDPANWFRELLIDAGLSYSLSSVLSTIGLVLIILFLAGLSNLVTKVIIRQVITRIVRKTVSKWDDIFLEQKVFTRLSHLAPALVIWFMAGWALKSYPGWLVAVQKLTYIYMVLVGMVVVNSFIESWHRIYQTLPISQHRHIKGYVQVVKLVVAVIASLVIISVVFRKEVSTVIAGLGAMAAVLLLIFKDAILGLVASIQLSANHMVKVGDWITIPSKGADGNVEDITLTTVKIRNFDKTIISVPAYFLVSDAFQNWSGMEESGIRQIKRTLFLIDTRSIRFADGELIDRLNRLNFIKSPPETDNTMTRSKSARAHPVTNLGLFRIYAEAFLKSHPLIDKNQTVLVRNREPEGDGLPLQLFAFSNDNSWVAYENLQSEITEHLMAVLGEFDLKVFQRPAGDDLFILARTK